MSMMWQSTNTLLDFPSTTTTTTSVQTMQAENMALHCKLASDSSEAPKKIKRTIRTQSSKYLVAQMHSYNNLYGKVPHNLTIHEEYHTQSARVPALPGFKRYTHHRAYL